MKKSIITIFLFVILVGNMFPFVAFAQTPPPPVQVPATDTTTSSTSTEKEGNYKFITSIQGFTGIWDVKNNLTLKNYLNDWFKILVGIGGVIAVVRLVITGFSIITSADSVDAKAKIKSELTAIVYSVILIAGAWTFLYTINPTLVTTSLFLDTITVAPRDLLEPKLPTVPGWYYKERDTKNGTLQYIGPFEYKVASTNTVLEPIGTIVSAINAINPLAIVYNQVAVDSQYIVWPYVYCEDSRGASSAYAINKNPEGECFPIPNQDIEGGTGNSSGTEASVRDKLRGGEVFVNRPACTGNDNGDAKIGYCGCTNVGGLTGDTVDGIIDLAAELKTEYNQTKPCTPEAAANKSATLCPVRVTGGTETKCHTSHKATNSDIFDLGWNKNLDDFLRKKAEYIAPSFIDGKRGPDGKFIPSGRPQFKRYFYNANWYTDEDASGGHHFHVCAGRNNKSTTCGDRDANGALLKCVLNTNNPNNSSQRVCLPVSIKACIETMANDCKNLNWKNTEDISITYQ